MVPKTLLVGVLVSLALGGTFLDQWFQVVPFNKIDWGSYAPGYSQSTQLEINDQATWFQVWNQAFCASIIPCPDAPKIDFNTTTVIAVFAGQKPTGGFSINVTQVVQVWSYMLVTVQEIGPGASCFSPQIITYPFHFVSIPKTTSLPVYFNQAGSRDC